MKKAILVFCSIALSGLFLILAVNRFKSYERTVSVRGLCEREVKADVAIYPISFSEGGDNLIELNKLIQKENQIIIEFLKENGFDDNDITVSVPSINDHRNDSYRSAKQPDFTMNSVVTIYTKKVDSVLALQNKLTSLIEKGIAISTGDGWSNPVTYNFAALNSIKPEMIEEANKSAYDAAAQFAKDSKSRVGKIKDASQGLFSIENRDANTPYIKNVRVVNYVTYYLR